MMKIKTSDLSGHALNFTVATALKMSWWTRANAEWDHYYGYTEWILSDKELCKFEFDERASRAGRWRCMEVFQPSTDWAQGGPILTEAKISRTIDQSGLWIAYCGFNYADAKEFMQCHTSELVAGLRCYVTMRLGATVDIPDDLL